MLKKLLIILLVLVVIGLAWVYIAIPKKLVISDHTVLSASDRATFQYLSTEEAWHKWFSGNKAASNTGDTNLVFNGVRFAIDSLFYHALSVGIQLAGEKETSRLVMLPENNKRTQLAWECVLDGTYNPITRYKQYQRALAIKQAMHVALGRFHSWMNKTENVYGFDIKQGRIQDSLLVTTRVYFSNYPTITQVDSVFDILKRYLDSKGATITGYPMLNIIDDSAGVYNTQFALPVNVHVPETAAIKNKVMFRGKALVAKFTGGPYTIEKAYEAADNYKADHGRVSPAVPFQSLITDRMLEADTSKWVTILYYPVK